MREQARRLFIALRCITFLPPQSSLSKTSQSEFPQSESSQSESSQSESSLEIARSAAWFPLAGFALGLGLALVYKLLALVLPFDVVCLAMVVLLTVCAGGRRLSASHAVIKNLAGRSRRRDSVESEGPTEGRFFEFATAGGLLLCKYLALSHMGEGWMVGVLILVPTLSGWTLVYLSRSVTQTSEEDSAILGYVFHVQTLDFWIATGFLTLAIAWFLQVFGLVLLALISMWTTVMERACAGIRNLPLDTVFQAGMEFNEVAFLLGILALRKLVSLSPAPGLLV